MKEIGSGLVEQTRITGGSDRMGDHIAGCRLAVSTRYNDDLHSPGGDRENIFGQFERNDSGNRGSAPSGSAQDSPRQFTGRDRDNSLQFVWLFHILTSIAVWHKLRLSNAECRLQRTSGFASGCESDGAGLP